MPISSIYVVRKWQLKGCDIGSGAQPEASLRSCRGQTPAAPLPSASSHLCRGRIIRPETYEFLQGVNKKLQHSIHSLNYAKGAKQLRPVRSLGTVQQCLRVSAGIDCILGFSNSFLQHKELLQDLVGFVCRSPDLNSVLESSAQALWCATLFDLSFHFLSTMQSEHLFLG